MHNFLIIIILIATDQAFKFLATQYLMNSQPITVIPNFLGLTYALNEGAGFSILSGKVNFLIIVTAVALLFIAYFLFIKKFQNRVEEISFLLIFAGGVGNLVDRILNGMVVDYLEFLFIEFPIFNFADILICCGVALFAVNTIYTEVINKDKNSNG